MFSKSKMDLTLRRNIEWIAEIPKTSVPYALQKMLISPLTIFKIKTPTILYHSLYPIFLYDNESLHFSILISQRDNIKNRDMLELLNLLDQIEYLTQNKDMIDTDMTVLLDHEAYSSDLNIKASFMSPGEIFANFLLYQATSLSTFYFIYSYLFGSSHMGIDGLIPKEARIKIIEHFLEQRKESVKKLELSAPDYKIEKKD